MVILSACSKNPSPALTMMYLRSLQASFVTLEAFCVNGLSSEDSGSNAVQTGIIFAVILLVSSVAFVDIMMIQVRTYFISIISNMRLINSPLHRTGNSKLINAKT